MTIQEMRDRKRELGLTNEMISKQTGIPSATVQKIFSGTTRSPRMETLQKLAAFLSPQKPLMIREPQHSYAEEESGDHTIADYYALPDDLRAELINGVFYDMSAPTKAHQQILVQLTLQFSECIRQHEGCELFIAPCDVKLNKDGRTMVQPDLFIACDQKDSDVQCFNGAPDLIVEIMSPSSRVNDLFRKLNLYRFAGVQEYWVVDPDSRKVLVYDLAHDKIPEQYTFRDMVPVLISGGKCRIDFSQVLKKAEKYLPL